MEEESDVLYVDKVIGKCGAVVEYNYYKNKQQYTSYVEQYKINPSTKNPALFSLQAIVNKDNKLCLFSNSNYDGCIPTQFIVTTKSTEHLINKCTSISEYYNKIKEMHSIDFDDLKSKIDQEFATHILAAKEFDEKIINENGRVGKGELDLGLDEALVYAYIFTHTDPEQHEKIRLFDWENINKGQHGFLKDSLKPDKIKKTLNIKLGEEVYLPMIVRKKQESKEKESKKTEYSHISFTTVIQEESNFTVKSFDTLGQNSSNEQYIKSQQTGTQTKQTSKKQTKEQQPQIILTSKIEERMQGISGCGFLTALNAVSYINGGDAVCPALVEEKGKTLPIEKTKKTLIEGFDYKIDENVIDKDGSIKYYPITIYYKDGRKAFEITKDVIEAIQQEKETTIKVEGVIPIKEYKMITKSLPSFIGVSTSSISTDDINYNHQSYQPAPQQDIKPLRSFQ